MTIMDRDRRRLHEELERTLGPDSADTLMELLPAHTAGELATREDLRVEAAGIRAEMANMGADVRTEMGELRAELRAQMSELRTELKGDVLRVENSLNTRIADMQLSMNRWALGVTAVNTIGLVTALMT